jgi:predicted O-methyltransferase YrrM
MNLSVIINTKDEGGRVNATCRAFLDAGADEIIVCADGTTDDSCDNLPNKVKVIRNEKSLGCGKAKFEATLRASGDVLLWVDAHQSVESGDIRRMAADALDGDCIITPSLANIFYDENWNAYKASDGDRLFFPNDASILPECRDQYALSSKHHSMSVGVGLCMSRQTYMRVGGWNRYQARHGSQERGIALKAFMAGVSVSLDESVIMGHEFFGQSHPSRNPNTGHYKFNNLVPSSYNAWHAYMAVCSPPFFESVIRPWLLRCSKSANGNAAQNDAVAKKDQAYFLRHCKTRKDEELLQLITDLVARTCKPQDTGGATLEPMALSYIKSLAKGRCLELGTGSAAGTKAMLSAAMQVISIDHMPEMTESAKTCVNDSRVEFLNAPIAPDGFYDLSVLDGKFDFILMDGPPGTKARSNGVKSLIQYLASGGIMLVDDANRDIENLKEAQDEFSFSMEILPTRRGLAKITISI